MTKYRIILFFILLIGNTHVWAQTRIAGRYDRSQNIYIPIDTNISTEPFSNGIAKFMVKRQTPPTEENTFSDQICGVLDTAGKIIILAKYDYLSLTNDRHVITTLNNRTEVRSLADSVILSNKYSWIYAAQKNRYIVSPGKGEGVVTIKDEIVMPVRNVSIREFGSGYLVMGTDGEALYNSAGKMIMKPWANTSFRPPYWETEYEGFTIFNQKTNSFIHYKDIAEFSLAGRIIAYYRDNKWGLMDSLGAEVTRPLYDQVRLYYFVFDPVLYSRNLIGAKMGGKWGVVDNHGTIQLNFEYDTLDTRSNRQIILKKGSKYGILKKGSTLATPIKYDEIYTDEQYRGGRFNDIIPVRIGRKWGFLNSRANEITPVRYDSLGDFSEQNHLCVVGVDGKFGLIDTGGREITPVMYDAIELFGHPDILVRINGLNGLLSQSGKLIIPVIYQRIETLSISDFSSEKYYYVTMEGKDGILDRAGKVVIPCQYDHLFFSGNKLPIVAERDKYCGLIDWSDKPLSKVVYQKIFTSDGYFFQFENDKKRGLLSLTGDVVVQPVYDLITGPYDFGYIISKNKKMGLLNKAGHIMVRPKYDRCEVCSPNHLRVTKKSKVGLLDNNGREIYPCLYKSINCFNGNITVEKFQ